MNLPFNKEQFLDVFRQYNIAVFPAQIIIYLLAAAVIILGAGKAKNSDSIICGILALFWLWMGIVYHIIFFSVINKLAYAFGTFFILQGFIFLYYGVYKSDLKFSRPHGFLGQLWAFMLLYALLVYPVLGYLFGHAYPYSPTFGLPCPTTIFTLGMLILSERKYLAKVFLVPLIWSVIGFFAAIKLGIFEDIGLLVSGILVVFFLFFDSRRHKKEVLT